MIKKITIRDVASYDHEGCTFDNMAKVNIIYGGNGTGKTTIGRVLKNDLVLDKYFPKSEVKWSSSTAESIYLFNKEFKEYGEKDRMLGVFRLGTQFTTLEKQREAMKGKREELSRKQLEAAEKAWDAEMRIDEELNTLREHLWKTLFEPHQDFKMLLKGFSRKASFTERVRDELKIIGWEKDRKPSAMGQTITQAAQENRELVTDVEELRRRYRGLFEGKNEKVNKRDLMNGQIFYEREMLRFDFWRYLAAKAKAEVEEAEGRLKALEKKRERYKKEEEIVHRELNPMDLAVEGEHDMVSSKQPAIDSINKTLDSYGFTGFRIEHSPLFKDDLQIQRLDGSHVEKTLSEGELTFISFLYFMEYATGDLSGWPIIMKKVMVLDDPISSLDDKVIMVVTMRIKELVDRIVANNWKRHEQRVSQIIIMTHNYRFYKMLTGELRKKDVKKWLLTKKDGVTKAREIGDEELIKDEYVALWDLVREASNRLEDGICGVGDVINLPNTIRKILERYFVTYGRYDRLGLLPNNFSKDAEDVLIAKSLLKWMDEGSHDVGDDLYMEHPMEMAERYLRVFKRLFEKLGHGAHYQMMMRED